MNGSRKISPSVIIHSHLFNHRILIYYSHQLPKMCPQFSPNLNLTTLIWSRLKLPLKILLSPDIIIMSPETSDTEFANKIHFVSSRGELNIFAFKLICVMNTKFPSACFNNEMKISAFLFRIVFQSSRKQKLLQL